MPADLISPRPDIVFLRRRLKVGETPPQVSNSVSSSSTSSSLNLNREDRKAPRVGIEEELTSSPIPFVQGIGVLRKVNDVYRLNKRQSAIGSLVISNAIVAGWQLNDGTSGYMYGSGVTPTESPETIPAAFKKRELVQFHKGFLVVGLRNLKHLKRLIVIAKPDETLQAETIGGAGVSMDYEPWTALYISVIDSMIEFRKEDFRDSITETFNLHTVKLQNARTDTNTLRTLFN